MTSWSQIGTKLKEQIVSRTVMHRGKAKEVVPTQLDGKFRFPLATADLRQPPSTMDRLQSSPRPIKWKDRHRRLPHRPVPTDDEAEGNLCSDDDAHDTKTSDEDPDFWLKPFDPIQEQQQSDTFQPDPDFWTISGDCQVRYIMTPRMSMFFPTEENTSIPLKYIDAHRFHHYPILIDQRRHCST